MPILAPTKELLTEFKAREDELEDHDKAFEAVDYEHRFTLDAGAKEILRELSEEAKTRDVYLVCHCQIGQYCHREILMVLAKLLYGAPVGRIHHPYDVIAKRAVDLSTSDKSLWR